MRYRSFSHSLSESDSSTVNLDISCDLSKENEVLNLVNQASDNPLLRTFQICYLILKS